MEATECGAACLTMILAHHQHHAPLAEVRIACGVSREGSRASDLLRAARTFGLSAQGWRSNLAGVTEAVLPAILFWDSNHFVVLEGWTRDQKYFWINDPALGHRRVEPEAFSRSFSGVILTFSPCPEFRRREAPPGILHWIWRKVGHEPKAAAFVALAALVLMIPSLTVPVLMRIFVDDYYINAEYLWLWPLLAGFSMAAILQLGLMLAIKRVLLRWEVRQAERDSRELLSQLAQLPMLGRLARGPTELAARLALPSKSARLIFRELADWLVYFPTALASIVWMSLFGWLWAVLFFVLILCFTGTLWVMDWIQREKRADVAIRQAQFENGIVRGLTLLESGRSGYQDRFLSQLLARWDRIFTGELHLAIGKWNGHIVTRFLAALTFVGILSIGAIELMAGRFTAGSLIAFLVLWLPLKNWLMQMFSAHRTLGELAIARARLADIPAARQCCARIGSIDFESIEMRSVSFGYTPTAPLLLKNISARISRGQRVALVGESGSGKSTLARLLTGMLEPSGGTVLVNDVITHPETLSICAAWSESVPVLWPGTAEDHVKWGRPALSSDQVTRALKAAGVPPEMAKRSLSGHIDNISGSQRQQLEMARLLAREPQLLILDEATNMLEADAETALLEEWQRRGWGWLWITHDPAIVRRSDEIWLLDKGEIAERGTWEELTGRSERFRRLMEL